MNLETEFENYLNEAFAAWLNKDSADHSSKIGERLANHVYKNNLKASSLNSRMQILELTFVLASTDRMWPNYFISIPEIHEMLKDDWNMRLIAYTIEERYQNSLLMQQLMDCINNLKNRRLKSIAMAMCGNHLSFNRDEEQALKWYLNASKQCSSNIYANKMICLNYHERNEILRKQYLQRYLRSRELMKGYFFHRNKIDFYSYVIFLGFAVNLEMTDEIDLHRIMNSNYEH